MSDETEGEEGEFEFEEAQPRAVMFDVPDGQIMIPCLDTLAEAIGFAPLAFWANDRGLFLMTPKRRWEPMEVDIGPKPVRKN